MINSFNNFYNNLSSDSLFFFWIIIFLFIFLVVISIILINKNKKLVKILKEEQEKVDCRANACHKFNGYYVLYVPDLRQS